MKSPSGAKFGPFLYRISEMIAGNDVSLAKIRQYVPSFSTH